MPGKKSKQRTPTALGLAIKTYLDTHRGMTHEKLADMLNVDVRTIARWKSGETVLTDPYELKRIADCLGISYKEFSLASSIYLPLTVERIDTSIDRIWFFVDEGRINEAHAVAENLVNEAKHQLATDNSALLRAITRMYHAIAHATSLHVKTEDVSQAIYYYRQMEHFARLIGDDTLINVALSYLGDMYRREGNIPRAIEYLEAARDIPVNAEVAARGNGMQLLGRAYLRANRISDFERAMEEAEALAHQIGSIPITGNQYNLSMVYEEYAKSYGTLGKIRTALDYVDRAEKLRPLTKSSEILMKVARAEILIRSGDIRNGNPLAIEAAMYTRQHGHYRRLERIYAIKRFYSQQIIKYGKADVALGDALEGPIDIRGRTL